MEAECGPDTVSVHGLHPQAGDDSWPHVVDSRLQASHLQGHLDSNGGAEIQTGFVLSLLLHPHRKFSLLRVGHISEELC